MVGTGLTAGAVSTMRSAELQGGVALPDDEVHLWWWTLDGSRPEVTDGLDAQERATAGAFRRMADRNAYLQAHRGLRQVLSRYLGVPPGQVRFLRTASGKPVLEGASPLQFNLSHSAGQAVCAVTRMGPVGVDVEADRSFDELEAMLSLVCTPEESATLCSLAPAMRASAFLQLWVRKEARLKASGEGLLAPERCAVGAQPYPVRQWRPTAADPLGNGWLLADCQAPAGYVAAVALARTRWLPLPPRDFRLGHAGGALSVAGS